MSVEPLSDGWVDLVSAYWPVELPDEHDPTRSYLVELTERAQPTGVAFELLCGRGRTRRWRRVDARGTEVEVTFVRVGEQTRVTLVHRGLERLVEVEAEKHAKYGWRLLMSWFDDFIRAKRSTP